MKEEFIKRKKDWMCQSLVGTTKNYHLPYNDDNPTSHVQALRRIKISNTGAWKKLMPHIGTEFSGTLAHQYAREEWENIRKGLLLEWSEVVACQKVLEAHKNQIDMLLSKAEECFENEDWEKCLKHITDAITIEKIYENLGTFESLHEKIVKFISVDKKENS